MLRLLIGLRILRGPRPTKSRQPHLGSTRRRVLLGICCVLIASAATHSGAGRAAGPSAITVARESIAGHIQDPSALFVTAAETRRILRHVDRVDVSYGDYGTDFSATVLYKPFSGDLTGQAIINRLPDANPAAEEKERLPGPRAQSHARQNRTVPHLLLRRRHQLRLPLALGSPHLHRRQQILRRHPTRRAASPDLAHDTRTLTVNYTLGHDRTLIAWPTRRREHTSSQHENGV
jgi:hypothetical protein